MDNQDNAGVSVGTAEPGPSFVRDVEQLGERVLEGVKDDAEEVGRKLHQAFTGGAAEAVVTEVVAGVGSGATAAVAAIAALGNGHVNIGKLDLTAELAVAKGKVEDAILALARHIGSGANG